MANPTRIRDAASIVVVGSFAPGAFTPAWLAKRGLIQKVEAEPDEAAKSRWVTTPDVAQFRVNWLSLQVLTQRFLASTETPDNFPLLRDLVQSIFAFFPETPVRQIGLNRDIRFSISTDSEWHQIGHSLAPKQLWKVHLGKPGLLSLAMHTVRPDSRPGHIQVTVRPTMPAPPWEVDVAYNSHFELGADATIESAVSDTFGEWDGMLKSADQLANDLILRAMSEPPDER